jgi:hypothetical protein
MVMWSCSVANFGSNERQDGWGVDLKRRNLLSRLWVLENSKREAQFLFSPSFFFLFYHSHLLFLTSTTFIQLFLWRIS